MLAYLHVSISLRYKFKLNLQSTLPFAETWRPNFQQPIQMHFLKILWALLLTEDRILKCLSNYCIEHSHTNVFHRRPDLEMPKLYKCVYLFYFLISYNELLIYSCIVFFISCPKRKNSYASVFIVLLISCPCTSLLTSYAFCSIEDMLFQEETTWMSNEERLRWPKNTFVGLIDSYSCLLSQKKHNTNVTESNLQYWYDRNKI